MRFLGWEITRRKDTLVPNDGRGWRRVLESFPGAWQSNIACDAPVSQLAFSAVYACVAHIANDISKMPINLVRKDRNGIWSPVEGPSPFWPVLRKPNAWQNRIQFVTCWLLSKLLTGNVYVLKERDGRGVVVRLYVLDPQKVQVRYTAGGQVFYVLNADDLNGLRQDTAVPASEIIHDLMNPLFHPLAGVSPLYACGMSATQGARIQKQSAQFFENAAIPSGILSSDAQIGDDLAKEYKARWQESYGGRNRGKVAVLGGGLKYQALTIPAEQAQLIEQLKWTAEDVARAFQVPAYKIGAGPMPTSNNVEALNSQYYSDVLQQHIESIELCLDEGLDLGPDTGTEFDLDVLLRMDKTALVLAEKEAVGAGIKSPNEARLRFNLPPVTGGATPYLQQQNYSLEALARRDAAPDPFETAAANDADVQDEARSYAKGL